MIHISCPHAQKCERVGRIKKRAKEDNAKFIESKK